jgi:hypothetical protein
VYLRDKYKSKLIIAEQGGLWLATPELISFLCTSITDEVVIIDTFDNPVKVNRASLREKLVSTYTTVMAEWHAEWLELEKKR